MWWQEAVVYQIYPRSFADATGDGVGDLDGLRARLEHLQWLGADAVWLSPIYRSPMADFGYDVADYCDVDPLFGDLAAFDALLAEAHARDIRVLLDWVPNHTSDQHPWFVESRASRDSPKRDWYRWHDGTPEHPPNNWPAAFGGGPAWTWDEATEQWYLHTFLPQQPDLNWDNARGGRRDARRAALLAGPRGRRLPRGRRAPHRQGPRAARHPRDRHRRQPPRRGGHPRLRRARTRCCGGSARCSTSTPATA